MRIKILVVISTLFLVSCIKDSLSECPYQYNIKLLVGDKNYSNTPLSSKIDENLAFKEYVKNVYYTLFDIKTGTHIIEPQLLDFSENDKEINIFLNGIPNGDYLFSAWGNVDNQDSVINSRAIHHNESESTDIYLISDTLSIAKGLMQNKTLKMRRVKGMLQIILKNIPDDIMMIEQSVSSVYQSVSGPMRYAGNVSVQKRFLRLEESLDTLSTYVAPTISGASSKLDLSFYTSSAFPVMGIGPLDIKLNRNEITLLEVNYDSYKDTFQIWVYIDGDWILVNNLDIE